MEAINKIGVFPPLTPDTYPKILSVIDEAGDYISNLGFDKTSLLKRTVSDDEHVRLQLGILYCLLNERSKFKFEFNDLILITKDNCKMITNHLLTIISECWYKITGNVRNNIVTLLVDVIPHSCTETLFSAVFKRMITGDQTQINLALVESVLVLIEEHRERILKERKLIPHIAYTYLRLIPTHYQFSIGINAPNNNLGRLCRKEISLVVDILKNNFDDCFRYGGRDILFVLQQVTNIAEFKAIWLDIYQNLNTLSQYFSEIHEIFSIGTPKPLLQTSIPFEMENWILWMMRNVHHCSTNPYKRYQEFFNKRFFSSIESQNLRPFLIRFIIRVFYPDNEMIGSTLISRWAAISWLIVGSNSQVVVSNCKLALIYDWLFYDSKYDCIMDIEPAILAIMHNLNKYSHVSITLVDFIVKTIHELIPPIKDKMAACFRFGLNEAIRVNVFRSLTPLQEVLKHHPDLCKQFNDLVLDTNNNANAIIVNTNPINNTVPVIVNPIIPQPQKVTETTLKVKPIPISPNTKEKMEQVINKSLSTKANNIANINANNNNTNNNISMNIFEDLKPLNPLSSDIKQNGMSLEDLQKKFMQYSLAFDYNVERISVTNTLSQISHNVTNALENLYNSSLRGSNASSHSRKNRLIKKSKSNDLQLESNVVENVANNGQSDIGDDDDDDNMSTASDEEYLQDIYDKMEHVVSAILSEDDNFDDLGLAGKTAAVICEICYPYFDKKLFPVGLSIDEDKLKSSLSHPIFVLFKNICNMSSNDNKREVLLLLLSEMQMRQPRIGYYLLYYLKVAKIQDPDLSTYRSLCNSLEKPNLKNSLYKDLELLSKDDSRLLVFLLPDLYKAFSSEMLNNAKFAHLVISNIDASELNMLVLEIHKNNLLIFDSNGVVEMLRSSLNWGTIEQIFLWDLLISHCIPAKHIYGLISFLDYKKHPEAMYKLSNILRQEKLSIELMKMLLNRTVEKGDHFTANLLNYWITKTKAKFTDILHIILSASIGHNNSNNSNIRDRKKRNISSASNSDEFGIDLIKILGHLDFLRQFGYDISFLEEESIQLDLKQVVNSRSLNDEVKSRFSELLVFVEEDSNSNQLIIGGQGNHNSSKVMIMNNSGAMGPMGSRLLRNSSSLGSGRSVKHYNDDVMIVTGASGAKKRSYLANQSSSSDEDERSNSKRSRKSLGINSKSKTRRFNSSNNNNDEIDDDDEETDEEDEMALEINEEINNNNNNDYDEEVKISDDDVDYDDDEDEDSSIRNFRRISSIGTSPRRSKKKRKTSISSSNNNNNSNID